MRISTLFRTYLSVVSDELDTSALASAFAPLFPMLLLANLCVM